MAYKSCRQNLTEIRVSPEEFYHGCELQEALLSFDNWRWSVPVARGLWKIIPNRFIYTETEWFRVFYNDELVAVIHGGNIYRTTERKSLTDFFVKKLSGLIPELRTESTDAVLRRKRWSEVEGRL